MRTELDKLNKLSESHGALRPGKGMVSGVIALSLAILCFLGVLAFHWPEYLTTPQLRRRARSRFSTSCVGGPAGSHSAPSC